MMRLWEAAASRAHNVCMVPIYDAGANAPSGEYFYAAWCRDRMMRLATLARDVAFAQIRED